jgi:hypothetical protein
MDRAGERVRVEEITTVSYGDGRETFVPWPLSPMTFTHYRTRRDRAAAGGW